MSSISASLKVADRVCDEIMDEFYQKVQESVNALLSNQGLLPVSMFAVLKTLRSTASDQMVGMPCTMQVQEEYKSRILAWGNWVR